MQLWSGNVEKGSRNRSKELIPICLEWGDPGMIWPKAAELWKGDHKDTKSC